MAHPSRTIARIAIGAVVGALSGIVALAVAARLQGAVLFDFSAELPRSVVSGLYPPERAGDLTFAWTSGRADLTLAGLDRDRAWTCTLRLRAGRPPGVPMPSVDLAVDGLTMSTLAPANEFEEIPVSLPVRSSDAATRLSLSVSPTFVPGPSDRRALGVQLDWIRCDTGTSAVPIPADVWRRAAAAPAIFGAAAGVAGLTTAPIVALAFLAAVAQAVPLTAGPAAYTGFAVVAFWLLAWIAAAACVAVRGLQLARGRALSVVSAAVIFGAGALLYTQLLGLLHPSKAPIDVVFHAHRFDAVLAGHYFFTQPMPGGVSFPYAIALYLFAAPWARLMPDHASLLRIVVCASDAIAYLLLYWLIVRAWQDRLAGAVAVLLAFGLPASHDVLGNANLTNEFGHAMSIAALAVACVHVSGRRRIAQWLVVVLLAATAFLSHVSTIALLAFTLVALAALFWWRGSADARRDAPWLIAATVLAAVLSVVVYYGHFKDVYVTALRVRSGAAAAAAPSAPTAPATAPAQPRGTLPDALPARAANAVRFTVTQLGWPVVVLAAAGAWSVIRQRRTDDAAWLVWACVAAYVVFTAVGVMRVQAAYQRYTVEFIARVVLATSPGALLLAGAGTSWGFRGRLPARVVATLLVGTFVVLATRQWLAWFA